VSELVAKSMKRKRELDGQPVRSREP